MTTIAHPSWLRDSHNPSSLTEAANNVISAMREIENVQAIVVRGISGATVGATVYGSDTAGEPAETAGTKTTIAGWAESATVLFVSPVKVSLS